MYPRRWDQADPQGEAGETSLTNEASLLGRKEAARGEEPLRWTVKKVHGTSPSHSRVGARLSAQNAPEKAQALSPLPELEEPAVSPPGAGAVCAHRSPANSLGLVTAAALLTEWMGMDALDFMLSAVPTEVGDTLKVDGHQKAVKSTRCDTK